MVLKINTAGVETTPKTEVSQKGTVQKQEPNNTVPMVEKHETGSDTGLKVEHQDPAAQGVPEEVHAEVPAPAAETDKEASKTRQKKLLVNFDGAETGEQAKTTSPLTAESEKVKEEDNKEVAAVPDDETLAAINKRLEAQQRQIDEQNRIIAQLRADAQAKAEAEAKAKAAEKAQRQAEIKAAEAEARANDAVIAANKAIIEAAGLKPAEEVAADPNEQADAPKPAEDGRPRPESGYEYLMDLNTKELKKLARSKDEAVARNAKLELEGRKHDRNIWTAPELSENERAMVEAAVEASGKDKPFYKNAKARRILKKQLRAKNDEVVAALDKKIEEAPEEEKQALKVFRDALDNKNLSKKYAKTVVRDLKIGDRVEHTVVVDSYKDKKEAKQKLGDEAGDFRIKRHSKEFMKQNQNAKAFMQKAEKEGKQISTHEAVYDVLTKDIKTGETKRISGDRTFENSEVTTVAGYGSYDETRYDAAKSELRKLGFKVDDGTWQKILKQIGAAVLGTLGGTVAGTLFSGGLSTVVEATVSVLAQAAVSIPELGISRFAEAKASASSSAVVNNWQNSAISAATASLISALMFSGPEEEVDLLRNHDRCDLFNDVPDGNGGTTREFELSSYGSKKKTKATKAILREIDKLELSDEQKVALLRKAAGDKGLGKLTAKELILAYIHGMDMVAGAEEEVKPDGSCGPCQTEDEPCPCEEDEEAEETPEEEPVEEPVKEPVDNMKYKIKEETIGIPHKSGVYNGWSLATKAYETVDGKKLTQKQIKELIDKIYGHNEVRRNGKIFIPKVWDLETEITLSDGTVVKLKPRDVILAMTAPKQENDPNLKMGAAREQKHAEGVVLDKDNKIVGDTIQGKSKVEVRRKILEEHPKAQEIDWTD